LKFFEIKNSKKTRVYFKIFGGTRIQKFETTRIAKFVEVQNVVKIMKKENRLSLMKTEGFSVKTAWFPYPSPLVFNAVFNATASPTLSNFIGSSMPPPHPPSQTLLGTQSTESSSTTEEKEDPMATPSSLLGHWSCCTHEGGGAVGSGLCEPRWRL
jgi:hypothetical protein